MTESPSYPSVMGRARAWVRFAIFGVWMCLAYAILVAGSLVVRGRRRFAWRSGCFQTWARGACRIIGLDLEIQGTPPPPPYYLVSNHLGYLDIIAYATVLHGRFVSKEEVADWPLMGRITRGLGTIYIDRGSARDVLRVGGEIDRRMMEGEGILVFPEGTSTSGDDILPFRPSLLDVAVKRNQPVHMSAIAYRTPPGSPPARLAVCWWGDMTFFSHVLGLLALPRIEGRIVFGEEPVGGDDRKALARRLREGVLSRYKEARKGWSTMTATGVIDANVALLQQGMDLIRDLDDSAYSEGEEAVKMSPIGAHLRHCIEYYGRFLAGLESGRIDYAARARDHRLETDRGYALQKMLGLVEALEAMPEGVESRPLEVDVEEGEAALDAPAAAWAQSDVRREMGFLMSHTVHHYALIAVVLRLKGHEPNAEFGVAPSTLAYEKRAGSCAR